MQKNMIFIIIILIIIIYVLLFYIKLQAKKYSKTLDNQATKYSEYLLKAKDYKKESKDISAKYKKVTQENKIYRDFITNYEKYKYEEQGIFNDNRRLVIDTSSLYKGKTILIADYNTWSSKHTKKILRSLGCTVYIVHSIQGIIEKLQENATLYDAIISNDIFKDGLGENCLETLRNTYNYSIPIIVHSVNTDKQYFLNCGFDEYLSKPVNVNDLKVVLKKIFEKKRKNLIPLLFINIFLLLIFHIP